MSVGFSTRNLGSSYYSRILVECAKIAPDCDASGGLGENSASEIEYEYAPF